MLTTQLITTHTELALLETPWNILAAGHPLRSWNWLATWWKHYGTSADRELHVLAVYDHLEGDAGTLVGIAPWYLEQTTLNGSILRPLGSGHVCTDHLSLICRPDCVATVATTIAEYLTANDDAWDRLELPAVDEGDDAITLLAGELEVRDALVSSQQSGNCWVIDLPETWDAYLATLSQAHRRQLRRCYEQMIDSGRGQWHVVSTPDELEPAWKILVELHQRRWESLGEAGCFASCEFHDFHREVVEKLLATKQLRLSWVEFDGTPLSAEYHMSGPNTVFTYQCGIDTERLKLTPGRLSNALTIKRAIEQGFAHLDFLRGDEPYKSHFRAVARPTLDYHIFPNRRLARLRGHAMLAAGTLKGWVKQGLATVKNSN